MRVQDGKDVDSQLTNMVKESLNIIDMRDAQEKIYNEKILRPEIARLAPKVMTLAEAGDVGATRIINQAVDELINLLIGTCRLADFKQSEEKVIVAAGGILRNNTLVYRKLSGRLHIDLPDYKLINPIFPPVVGAFILSLQLGGVKITDNIIRNINNSLSTIRITEIKK